MSAGKSEINHGRRVVIALALIAIFLGPLVADFFLDLYILPVVVSLFSVFCIVELWSLRDRKEPLLTQSSLLYLHLLIVVAATAAIWVARLNLADWPLFLLAVAVPVLIQNTAAFYIGRFIMPRIRNHKSPIAKLLEWHHFRHSPRKTFGVIIVSAALAAAISAPWFLGSHLLTTVAIVSALAAAAGDLLESRLKRQAGVDDSGEKLRSGDGPFALTERTIAAHGGFLDRFDSLFFCIALNLITLIIFIL